MMRRHPRHVEGRAGLRKLRSRATLACCLAVAAALAVVGCASSSSSSSAPSAMSAANEAAMQNPNLDLGTSLYGEHAPDIKLVNQFGQPMSLSQFRGRVVILAFSDSECTTVCPLTTQSMVLAKELLGKAGVPDPARMLRPLLSAALDNALVLGDAGLTGPVARADADTVASHVAALQRASPEALRAYVALARLTADRALAAGLLAPPDAQRLLEVLAGAPR